ncbi:uncharacterized protein LOC128767534 isoform X1 [Synchiropus splendidus]|uniref:uncharacterized protein LOC128767534 isoform X1 n=1 Tax=Synchiropus splendidus TaxID=270530 RepID=UPI00237E2B77|nr:uncharacterized protein LOC128767534 isoform X1 [Synchiropus splendidus]
MRSVLYLALLFLVDRCESDFKVLTLKVQVGHDVTLSCHHNDSRLWQGHFYWIRHTAKHVPEVLAASPQHGSPEAKIPRITVTRPRSSEFVMDLSGAHLSDTGFYFCIETQYLNLLYYNATFLLVTDTEPHKTAVVQTSPLEQKKKLQCSVLSDTKKSSCSEEDRVFWFKSGDDESTPDLLIAHENRGDECQQASPHTCVYHLPINSSDTGTYYCAVVSCGRVLFGNGTKHKDPDKQPDLVTVVLGCSLAVNLVVMALLTGVIMKQHLKLKTAMKQTQTGLHEDQQQVTEDVLVYAAPTYNKRKTARKENNANMDNVIYSGVRGRE